MSLDVVLLIERKDDSRQVRLEDYLEAADEEAAETEAYAWIKGLRHARVSGQPLRERFTYRGDSLWWFAELYLHKEQAILTLFRAIRAAEALLAREQPRAIRFTACGRAAHTAVTAVAAAHGVHCDPIPDSRAKRRVVMDARSSALAFMAMASPGRPRRSPERMTTAIGAFVHRAFWKAGGEDDGSAESYIGPVLHELEQRLPAAVRYVGLGPSTNFRARRWWRQTPEQTRRIVPIERLVPRRQMRGSWQLWKTRHAIRRELSSCEEIRRAAVIHGYDCWPIVREALDGIALLQFPWSARAMDEAGAALDVIQPRVAITYAEAGGWGRALALEARRRNVPLVGLQHGFIYRHWLNYRHEPDEMVASVSQPSDRGFPIPALTLVFDEFAARHLVEAGRFPESTIAVTGSPRLDAVAAESANLPADALANARREAGATESDALVLVASKYSQIRGQLAALLDALRGCEGVRAVIKTHPAETPEPYLAAAAATANVRVLPASSPLAPLLRAARLVVTVNSTIAIDAMVLGIPALAVGLPNNLSPFVEAGAMAGSRSREEIEQALRRVLYDEGFRQQLKTAASALTIRYGIVADGRSAERSASAILELAGLAPATGQRHSLSR
ncbi:MAG: hypothetical protein WBC51_22445 [Vicinamibacterales bacterium]